MTMLRGEAALRQESGQSLRQVCRELEMTRHALNKSKERLDQLIEVTVNMDKTNLLQIKEIKEQAEISESLLESLKREKFIKHIVQLVNRTFEVNVILEMVTREIGTFLGADRCLAVCYEEQGSEKTRVGAQYCNYGVSPLILEGTVPCELVLGPHYLQQPGPFITISDLDETFSPAVKAFLQAYDIRSALIIPIVYRDIRFGRLSLHQCSHHRIWTEQERNMLEILVEHIGAALSQTSLFNQAQIAQQKAEEANRLKTQIMSYVSHDFKTPLTAILRLAEILETEREDVLSETQRELVKGISEGTRHLHRMVKVILDKARLENGQMFLAKEWIELRPFMVRLKAMFEMHISNKNLEWFLEIEPDLQFVKADPIYLQQILVNLVSNAIKYNQINGEIRLKFYRSENQQSIVIEVQDTGIGISREKLPGLFTDYFRADLSQDNPVEGDGLGLTFVKAMVELHEGHITVESDESGSTFKISLPFPLEPLPLRECSGCSV